MKKPVLKRNKVGAAMRGLRTDSRLTLRDVENLSTILARKRGNWRFRVPPSRLSAIENDGMVPSIHRIAALAIIYQLDMDVILRIYGI